MKISFYKFNNQKIKWTLWANRKYRTMHQQRSEVSQTKTNNVEKWGHTKGHVCTQLTTKVNYTLKADRSLLKPSDL